MKKLLIFGAGETATIAAEFFVVDSHEKLHGFVVDDAYHKQNIGHLGLPVYSLSRSIQDFSPADYKFFVALSYGQLNRERLKVFNLLSELGYEFATYISSKCSVWRTAEIGKNCMIFEGNNVQHNCIIEDNVILWSGNHIGHGSKVLHSSYISSHACIAGFAEIGERSFIGINSSITDFTKVAEDCFIGAAALINKNTESNSIYTGNPAIKNSRISATKFFKVKE
jgi:sugar O-acyltransferase (sialic acid O-acetyltransferase NeuD family)